MKENLPDLTRRSFLRAGAALAASSLIGQKALAAVAEKIQRVRTLGKDRFAKNIVEAGKKVDVAMREIAKVTKWTPERTAYYEAEFKKIHADIEAAMTGASITNPQLREVFIEEPNNRMVMTDGPKGGYGAHWTIVDTKNPARAIEVRIPYEGGESVFVVPQECSNYSYVREEPKKVPAPTPKPEEALHFKRVRLHSKKGFCLDECARQAYVLPMLKVATRATLDHIRSTLETDLSDPRQAALVKELLITSDGKCGTILIGIDKDATGDSAGILEEIYCLRLTMNEQGTYTITKDVAPVVNEHGELFNYMTEEERRAWQGGNKI